MQWIACSLLLFTLSLSPTLWAAKPEAVRVRIKSQNSKIQISGLNLRLIGQEVKFNKVTVPQDRKLEIGRVAISGKNYWQISYSNNPQAATLSSHPALIVQGENLRQESTDLPNQVILQENQEGLIDLIGVIPMEEYVFSVLASEMPLSWPMETLKAQAIAIRSYTEAVLEERKGRSYQLESSVLDQVYKKITGGRSATLLEKARQAVRETEGMILLNQKGRVLKAFYHSDCGGKTVPASSVWKQEKDMDAGVTVDAGCPTNPKAQWRFELPKEKFVQLIKNFLGDIRSNDFRQILGFTNLKSTNFEVLDKDDRIEFVGQGFGHRVGLCQWGSKTLGLKGLSHDKILKHYYPLARLSSNLE